MKLHIPYNLIIRHLKTWALLSYFGNCYEVQNHIFNMQTLF